MLSESMDSSPFLRLGRRKRPTRRRGGRGKSEGGRLNRRRCRLTLAFQLPASRDAAARKNSFSRQPCPSLTRQTKRRDQMATSEFWHLTRQPGRSFLQHFTTLYDTCFHLTCPPGGEAARTKECSGATPPVLFSITRPNLQTSHSPCRSTPYCAVQDLTGR